MSRVQRVFTEPLARVVQEMQKIPEQVAVVGNHDVKVNITADPEVKALVKDEIIVSVVRREMVRAFKKIGIEGSEAKIS